MQLTMVLVEVLVAEDQEYHLKAVIMVEQVLLIQVVEVEQELQMYQEVMEVLVKLF